MRKTVWVIHKIENITFEVSETWLDETIRAWAERDSIPVDNDKTTYINGRIEELYDQLEDDEVFVNEIYNEAYEEDAIISFKELKEIQKG